MVFALVDLVSATAEPLLFNRQMTQKWGHFFGSVKGDIKVDSFMTMPPFWGSLWLELLIYLHRLSVVKGLVRVPVVAGLKPPG